MPDRNRGADQLFSQVVRARESLLCQRCARPGDECAHIVRRRYLRTRWVSENAWWLCRDCHRMVDTNELQFAKLVEETIGGEKYDELRALAHSVSLPKPDRVAIRAELRGLLKEWSAA